MLTAGERRQLATYFEDNSWCQGVMFSADGSSCAKGAIIRTVGQFSYLEACEAENELIAIIGRPVAGWNDDPSRTIEDVRRAFRKAFGEEGE